jgi:hypothetical protein
VSPILPVGKSADAVDVLRSVRRWYGKLLPAPWDIQYQRDEIQRPGGFVVPSTPVVSSGSAYVREWSLDFDVFLYPDGFEGEPARSRIEAEQLRSTVMLAWNRGIASYSRTMRLPVFDYLALDWDEAPADDAVPFDHLPVSNVDVAVRVDPDDDSLFTVVTGLRVRWTGDGDLSRFSGAILQNVVVRNRIH